MMRHPEPEWTVRFQTNVPLDVRHKRRSLHRWLPAHREDRLLPGTLLRARGPTLASALFGSHLGAQVAGVVVAARVDRVVMGG